MIELKTTIIIINSINNIAILITIFPEFTKENIRGVLPNLQSGIIVALVYIATIIAISHYISRYKLKDNN